MSFNYEENSSLMNWDLISVGDAKNADDENTNIETGNFEANPSDLNQNLRIKASSAKPRLEEVLNFS